MWLVIVILNLIRTGNGIFSLKSAADPNGFGMNHQRTGAGPYRFYGRRRPFSAKTAEYINDRLLDEMTCVCYTPAHKKMSFPCRVRQGKVFCTLVLNWELNI